RGRRRLGYRGGSNRGGTAGQEYRCGQPGHQPARTKQEIVHKRPSFKRKTSTILAVTPTQRPRRHAHAWKYLEYGCGNPHGACGIKRKVVHRTLQCLQSVAFGIQTSSATPLAGTPSCRARNPFMPYSVLITLHLFAAFIFVGTVFFEVLMLEGVRKHVSRESMREIERAIGKRARQIMPWTLLVLYSAGIGMAWHYRSVLAHPFDSAFGTMLTIKIVLALSVLGHFITAMVLGSKGLLNARYVQRIHTSVFTHMVGIVLLAKAMLYLNW